MADNLPESISRCLAPLFDALPLHEAMSALVVQQPAPDHVLDQARTLSRQEPFATRPTLTAGLWLYVDQLDESHRISQGVHDATGSFWHGIMHRREGDFSNSHYWFRKAGNHPAMSGIDCSGGYDPHAFINRIDATHHTAKAAAELVECQRREWQTLLAWCAVL